MKTTEQNWYVLADPQWENHHPLHKCRYIATKPEWDYVEPAGHGEEWQYGFDDSEGKVVCKLTDLADQPDVARLIAAAPEMLETLKMVRDQLFNIGHLHRKDVLGQIDKAIQKATGIGPN